jgi:hypothetical protein
MLKPKPQPQTIFDKIRALEAECHEYINQTVDREKSQCPGVPKETLEQIYVARSNGNVFAAVLGLESQS